MKKILSLIVAVLGISMMLQAETVNWSVANLTGYSNGDILDEKTLGINDNLSLKFSNGTGTNDIKYQKSNNVPYIAFYSNNIITVTGIDATITSITFVVDDDSDNPQTTQTTPGWKVKVVGTTYSIDSPTWTGNSSSVEVVGNSKTVLLGLTIEYIPAGSETTLTWSASELSDVANNELLNGRTFDINDVLSFTLADNDCDQGKEVIFKKTSSLTDINLYSRNSITFNAKEGTTIQSIKFITNTTIGTNPPTGWTLQDEAKNSYNATNDTWTGNVSEITFTCKSAAQLMGFEIVYVTTEDNSGEGEGEGDGDDDGDDDLEYKEASLFFTEDLVSSGAGSLAQNFTITDNGTSIEFTSNSANAKIELLNSGINYGTVDDYTSYDYRYSPGGKSSNGVNSTNKGIFSFPCAGTLYIYAYNNQTENRNLQLVQNSETIFDHTYKADDYASPENKNTKIYPIESVTVEKGTATLLWPTNQVMISGFTFVPDPGVETGVETVTVNFEDLDGPAYDLFGRQVSDDYRGIYIKNGKKYIRR